MNQVATTSRRADARVRAREVVVSCRAERRALSKRVAVNAVSNIAKLATIPGASTSG
jgi:hypothetical protein